MPYGSLYRFWGFREKGVEEKFLRKEERFDGLEVCNFFCQDSRSVLGVPELKAAFGVFLQL
jgi:hypothetical protein